MDHVNQVTSQLSSYFANGEAFPNCVYLFGQKSVGKSLCLQKFLESQREWLNSVVISSAECYTSRILFETVISAFNNHELSEENNYESFANVESVQEFLEQLSMLDNEKSYLIAIENAEKLRDMEFVLQTLMGIQKLTGLNISCVLVSHLAFEKLYNGEVIRIHVPDYTKSDIIEILVSRYKDVQKKIVKNVSNNSALSEEGKNKQLAIAETLDEVFYQNYLNIFLDVFYKATRGLTELQALANKCYSSYYAPVLSGDILSNDVVSLWRNITKVMKVSLQVSHLRIENLSAKEMTQKIDDELTIQPENNLKHFAQTLELPHYAKFLLIASFLASHNEAKYDKRLFMKHHGKERKRKKKVKV